MGEDESSVRVAIRIRPLIARELVDMCRVCTNVSPGEPQVWLGSDKAFTYDNVFDTNTSQQPVYDDCVHGLIEGCFSGYNATVLAYGQTGSGKTYTMGTGLEVDGAGGDNQGIVPRAVDHLFRGITERREAALRDGVTPPEFKVTAHFMELYNEEVIDLFDSSEKGAAKPNARIHEDASGSIYVSGVTTRSVTSLEEAMQCLRSGALSRTTASTNMNAQSSRSHAVFTVCLAQQRMAVKNEEGSDSELPAERGNPALPEFETLSAKFHFVDLAGSERIKRTGATGDRVKESIAINSGLLALGNVISALGDQTKRATHVPYRDSKLTRLLQDSLGGNSQTVMIACISPSDSDFMETLNTLKYANRARNIKNRVTVNQDKTSKTIALLRAEIQQLQLELMEYKQGKRTVGVDGSESVNDMFHENQMLLVECNNLRTRVKALQETVEVMTGKNTTLLAEQAIGLWGQSSGEDGEADMSSVVKGYLEEIEKLRAQLCESELVCQQLRKQASNRTNDMRISLSPYTRVNMPLSLEQVEDPSASGPDSLSELIEEAKVDLEKDLKEVAAPKKSRTRPEARRLFGEDNNNTDEQRPELGEDGQPLDGDNNRADDNKAEDNNRPDDSSSEGDDDTSDESGEDKENFNEELAELTSEISMKQKLIEGLEQSQRKLETMRQQYEDKLALLGAKITATQDERDKVLSSLKTSSANAGASDKVKQVRQDYERKISGLQKDMKKMQSAQKEHAKLMREKTQFEHQLRTLKTDLADMKRAKVRLFNKMKEDSSRAKKEDVKKNREIAQLRKEKLKKENTIKNLEAENRLKNIVLKRKTQEIAVLKRVPKKALSDKAAGKVRKRIGGVTQSPKTLKHKWQNLEQNINKVAFNRQTVGSLERDMDRWLKERESLSRQLEKASRRRERLDPVSPQYSDVNDQMDGLKANINYIQENIAECQENIMVMEENKDGDTENLMTSLAVQQVTTEENEYLLGKLITMTINQATLAAQKQAAVSELENKMKQMEQNTSVQEQLLAHVLGSPNDEVYSLMSSLLAGGGEDSGSDSDSEVSAPELRPTGDDTAPTAAHTLMPPPPPYAPPYDAQRSLPLSTETPIDPRMTTSLEGAFSRQDIAQYLARGGLARAATQTRDNTEATPPESPSAYRRQTSREENVFNRLTSSHTTRQPQKQQHTGVINPYSGRASQKSVLACTHVAQGHTKAVLSVCATEDKLFSASKDRTVKVWDLERGQEIHTLTGHPNNVNCVKYCQETSSCYTVSSSYIKVWDLRDARCHKTLSSSGLTSNGAVAVSHQRSLMPPGETQVNDIALSPSAPILYSAASNIVRVWDLRMHMSVGKLSGGHQAAVMCLAVDSSAPGCDVVATGSKDHSIKVFDVADNAKAGLIPSRLHLSPPHYDGIQSLALYGDTLFSGSRDMCIKKWDLSTGALSANVSAAHRDWVCALCFNPGGQILLSGCRGGVVKMWSTENCQVVGELRAHASTINAITTNSTCIFTASNDCSIGMWRVRTSYDVSPELSDAS